MQVDSGHGDDPNVDESSLSDSESDAEDESSNGSQNLITQLFSVTKSRSRSGMPPKMPADERAEMQRIAREQSIRDHEAKKKLPKITEVTWTHKDRKKNTVVQELTRMMRQLQDYLKIDAIRETAFVQNDGEKAQLRAVRMQPLSFADADKPPPGLQLAADGSVVTDPNGDPNVTNARQYDAFQEANMTLVNCILDAIRDPTLNNELEKIHSRHADAQIAARTGILLIKHLKDMFDSDDFVYRFLHLLDFIEWEQGRSVSHTDYADAFMQRAE